MKLPVELLVALCVLVGLAPGLIVAPWLDAVGGAVFGAALPPHDIAIFHGFNRPLAMSGLALAAGALVYWGLERRFELHLHAPRGWSGRLLFALAVQGLLGAARRVTAALDDGAVQRSLALLVASALALGAAATWSGNGAAPLMGPLPLQPVDGVAVALWLALAAAALGAVLLHRRRLVAVILVAIVGLVVSLAFVYFSAPDLALTQISVEVVATVLMLMSLALLPGLSPAESSAARRARDAVLAIGAGCGVGMLAWAVMTRPLDSVSWYYLQNSLPEAGGSNVVNVILVDFRGFDTLGEITVLAIAALGVAALMEGLSLRRDAPGAPGRSRDPYPLMLATAANVMLPLTLMVSAYLFLRGHNAPGGGFIAGLVAAIGLVTQYMADGFLRTERRLRLDFARVAGAGVALAGATGLAAWLFGAPFLSSAHGHPALPLLGEVPLSSALAFDLGVYLVVVGGTLLMLATLAGASEREARA
jgi:multicomponent K+:H+ antiporter subunit A